MIGDWEWENDRLVTVGLGHGAPVGGGPAAQVHTTVRNPRADVASLRMADTGPPRDRADVFRLHHEFQAADAGSATIVVDAASVVFASWREADRWWAAGHHDGYGLVIEARGIPLGDVRLVRVHDLEPYIAGRRAYLRALRSEG